MKCAKTLEIGCGKHRHPLADVAVDIDKDSSCDLVADAHFLPFPHKTFSKVIMYETLEHVENASKVLREINNVLTDKGKVEFSIPNAMYWRCILRWIVKGKISASPNHINCWRLSEIEALLHKTGFLIKSIRFIDTHFHPSSFFAVFA